MKEFNCKSCNKTWFVKLDTADEVSGCPFCLKELPKPRVIVVDSFEDAVLKVIVDYGVEIVSDRRKFLSYLTDVAFDYRKEIKILSNACDARTFVCFYELTQCSIDDAKIKVKQIEKKLVDEEGIAETWAKRICNCFINALREDYSKPTNETTTVKATKNNQFKLNQLAKDLGMDCKALIDILSARGYDVKSQTTLGAVEFDILMDQLTRANQIENIYDYINGVTYIPSNAKPLEEKKTEEKKSEIKANNAQSSQQLIVPVLKPTRVQSIYQWEIRKKVTQPNFPNWFNKKNSRRVYFDELIIPNSVTQINEGQFRNDKSFDWLIVGNGLKTIPKRAFQNISAEFVYLSDGVERIDDYAFADSDIKCVIVANHSNISISDTAFLRSKNIKLIFVHEWFSDIVKHCDSNNIAHAGLGPMEAYFAEYAKIKLKEMETN